MDILERLSKNIEAAKNGPYVGVKEQRDSWQEAAHEIERLRKENEGLRYDVRMAEAQHDKQFEINKRLNTEVKDLKNYAQFIIDGYANHDLNHVDFRVGAYKNALKALDQEAPEEKMLQDLGFLPKPPSEEG